MNTRAAIVLGLCAMFCTRFATADSWPLPHTTDYISTDGSTKAIIVPRVLSSQLEYFEDKGSGKSPAGQRIASSIDQPFARVSQRKANGQWSTIWQQPLINDVAPVDALVASREKYLITFDNWHHRGYGEDAIVIYDARGRVVRKYRLIDFLPLSYIETLSTSTSSIHWGRGHFLTDKDETLILRVAEPSFGFEDQNTLTISVRIRLADGAITPPAGRAWERALRRSKKVRQQQKAYEQKACRDHGGRWCKR